MKEVYKTVAGWSNYLISNFGNLRSIDMEEKFRGATRLRRGRQMKIRILDRYLAVTLKQDGRHKTCLIHRLVAIAFVKNPNNYETVNHLDRNRLNNRWDNLEWCTQKMNIHHSMEAENWTRGEGHGNAKLTNEQVLQLRQAKTGISKMALDFGVTYKTAKLIRSGKAWQHVK